MLHLALKPAHLISKNFTTHVLFFPPISPGLSSKGYPMTSISSMISNAIVNIWQAEGIAPILKYEDDLKIFQYPVDEGIFIQGKF